MPRCIALALELLEDRTVPALFGTPWPDAHLTLSFAPDGTSIAGSPSNLFATLNTQQATPSWQTDILRSFQTWAQSANINLSVVPDGGQAFGSPSALQGDSRFGDVRIGARSLSAATFGLSTPFDLFNNWSGEVVLNSSVPLGKGSSTTRDLFSVVLQEAGHVFGIGNSSDPASPMYDIYGGVRTGPTAADLDALYALYGRRRADRFDQAGSNDTTASATRLRFVASTTTAGSLADLVSSSPYVAQADITTTQDVDFYRVKVDPGATSLSVALRTSGLSLLTARVSVYDAAGRLLATGFSSDPLHGDVSLSVGSVLAGRDYLVKVQGSRADAFGVGAYRLAVGTQAVKAVYADTASPFVNDDRHTNDKPGTATLQPASSATADARVDAVWNASLSDATDVDHYLLRAPAPAAGTTTSVLTVTAWATNVNGVRPRLTITDPAGKPLSASVISDTGTSETLQIEGITANQLILVKVAAAPGAPVRIGNYSLSVNFRPDAIRVGNLAAGTLGSAQPLALYGFQVNEAQLFHFELDAAGATVGMTVFSSAGQAVFSLVAPSGTTARGDVFLLPDICTVRILAAPSPSLVRYQLRGIARSDSIGPELLDPTATPTGSNTTTTTTTTSTTSSSTSTTTSSTTTTSTTSSSQTTSIAYQPYVWWQLDPSLNTNSYLSVTTPWW